jgi:hypothetical protein
MDSARAIAAASPDVDVMQLSYEFMGTSMRRNSLPVEWYLFGRNRRKRNPDEALASNKFT